MANVLSVKQFAMLALGQAQPPWRLGNLCALYNTSPISLKSSIEALSKATAVVFVNAATFQGIYTSHPVDELESLEQNFMGYWLYGGLNPVELQSLEQLLQSSGVTITYVSQGDWVQLQKGVENLVSEVNTIGLAGTYADLAALNVQEIPGTPWAWTPAQLATAKASSFLINGISGVSGYMATFYPHEEIGGWYWGDPPFVPDEYLPPIAALSPGVSSDKSGLGLLGVVQLNQGVNTMQALITCIKTMRELSVSVTQSLCSEPYLQGIADANAAANSFLSWINGASATKLADIPSSVKISCSPNSPLFQISALTYQVDGSTGETFTFSEFTVNPDGASSGGALVSAGTSP